VDEADIGSVKVGQTVDISVDAYPDQPFVGKVARINPQAVVEQNITLIHVRVEVNNKVPAFKLLKPGLNATCDFVVSGRKNVLMVPNSAVQTRGGKSFVRIASGGTPAPGGGEGGSGRRGGGPGGPPSGGPGGGRGAGGFGRGGGPDDGGGTLVGVSVTNQPVVVGVIGDETTEITAGLKPGEKVVEQTIAPATELPAGGSPISGRRG
jgi:multidrug efflux pump subunit AcrA (membrane-fusion protein)